MQNVKSVFRRLTAILPLIALVAFWLPVLQILRQSGVMTRSYDGMLYFMRTSQLEAMTRQGVLWPRWMPGMAFGYGYPLFNFYPALSFYPVLVLHRLGPSLLQSWNLVLALSILASGLTMYLWGRQVFGRCGGFVASVAFMLAPYQLYDVYWRGNLAESLTLPLLPVAMWSVLLVAQRRRWIDALVGAIAYAAILLMHAPASLMLTLVLLVYGFALLWTVRERRKFAVQFSGQMLIGIGLAAFFLVPAFLERDQVQLWRAIVPASADFHHNFVSLAELLGATGPADPLLASPPRSLSWVVVVLAVLGILAAWRAQPRVGDLQKLHIVWATATVTGIAAMTLPLSAPIWSHVPLLPFIQYPWRFLGIGSLLLALLAGSGVAALDGVWANSGASAAALTARRILALGGCGVWLAVGAYPWMYPRLAAAPDAPNQAYYTEFELDSLAIGTTAFGEYLPKAVQEFPAATPLAEPLRAGRPLVRWDAPSARWLGVYDDGLHASLTLDSSTPVRVIYRAFYFPGWQARLDGQPISLQVESPSGLMAIQIPAGQHTVRVDFGGTPLRTASSVVTLVTMVVAAVMGWKALHSAWVPSMPAPGQPLRPVVWLGLASVGVLLMVFKAGWVDRSDLALKQWRWAAHTSQPATALPPVAHQINTQLGEWVILYGYAAPDRAMPGQPWSVTLVWQALRETRHEYKVFVHLLDSQGQIIAQSDAVPASWTRPTNDWSVGEVVTDTHVLDLPGDLPPGSYRLVAGMYDYGGRLPVVSGGNAIGLGQIQVSAR